MPTKFLFQICQGFFIHGRVGWDATTIHTVHGSWARVGAQTMTIMATCRVVWWMATSKSTISHRIHRTGIFTYIGVIFSW